jgi:hypothetical protein
VNRPGARLIAQIGVALIVGGVVVAVAASTSPVWRRIALMGLAVGLLTGITRWLVELWPRKQRST